MDIQLANPPGLGIYPNNKWWWLKTIGRTSFDPKWPFLGLIFHLCISDMETIVGMREQGGAQAVTCELG